MPQLPFLIIIALLLLALLLLYRSFRHKEQQLQQQLTHAQQQLQTTQAEATTLSIERAQLQKELELLRTHEEEKRTFYQEQTRALEERFTALSEEITKKRAEELSHNNHQQLHTLLSPLKEQIAKMETTFQAGRESSAKQSGELKEAIARIMASATEVGSKADALSLALQGQSKLQGNWGEQVLQVILEREGMQQGRHFETQKTFTTKEGRYIPDAILYLPGQRALIVDAKVSLTHYTQYYHATDPSEQARLGKEHLKSVEKHIRELSEKQYYKLIEAPYSSMEYVVMFLPISGALELALQQNQELWNQAAEKGIFIATDRSLLAVIHIINMVWRQYDQERNVDKIIEEAEKLLKRLADFLPLYDKLGSSIAALAKAHEEAGTKVTGRQGILPSAQRLQALGIRNTSAHSLPSLPQE